MRVPARVAALLLAGLLPAAAGCGEGEAPASSSQDALAARVERVVDGDTIIVRLTGSGARERVRYIGIDTPESVRPDYPIECYGPQASALNRSLVDGRTVLLELDRERRDRYGRMLAYVIRLPDRQFVNGRLVADGAARILTIPPNTSHAAELRRLEQRARRAGRGLWGACPR